MRHTAFGNCLLRILATTSKAQLNTYIGVWWGVESKLEKMHHCLHYFRNRGMQRSLTDALVSLAEICKWNIQV